MTKVVGFKFSLLVFVTLLALGNAYVLVWLIDSISIRGQPSKHFYTLGQIYKCVLKHENNMSTQIVLDYNFKTLHTNISIKID